MPNTRIAVRLLGPFMGGTIRMHWWWLSSLRRQLVSLRKAGWLVHQLGLLLRVPKGPAGKRDAPLLYRHQNLR